MVDFYDNDSSEDDENVQKKPARATAVALTHNLGKSELPTIAAAGYGAIAEQIVQIAFDNGVKVRSDGDLAQMLAAIELDSEIPSEALIAVAEVLSYVYKENGTLASIIKKQEETDEQ